MPISLSIVVSAVIVTAAFVAALVAFTPTYIQGIESSQSTVADLRNNIIVKARVGIEKFMLAPVNAIEAMSRSFKAGVINASYCSDESKIRMTCELLRTPGVSQAIWTSPDVPDGVTYFTVCDNRESTRRPGQVEPSIGQTASTAFYTYARDPVTGLQNFADGNITMYRFPKVATKSPVYSSYAVTAGKGNPTWINARSGIDSTEYSVGFSFPDPYGGTAYMTVKVIPKTLGKVLEGLELRNRARAFIVDAKSGIVVGNNWNAVDVILFEHWEDPSKTPEERMHQKNLTDYADPLMNDVVEHFGGPEAFLKLKVPLATTMGKGKDKVYLNIENITDPYGLDMRVVIAMPELDFMEDTYKSRDMTIGIVVACLVVMVIIAVLFSVAITKPIDRIGERMYRTASLQDDDDDEELSVLSEVQNMQFAYATMRSELNRMKSYLPQSVLCGADIDDDDDELASEGTRSLQGSSYAASKSMTPRGSPESRSVRSHRSDGASTTASRSNSVAGHVNPTSGGGLSSLNTKKGCATKRVVVAVFNLLGFHSTIDNKGTDTALSIQTKFIALVSRAARENRGVVDSFQGDHIIVTFNAVNNVACPGKRAAAVASQVASEAAKEPTMPRVSVGISFGMALVGNTGCNDLQRFNIMGTPYLHALAIERRATQLLKTCDKIPHAILVCGALQEELSLEYLVQAIDVVSLPTSKGPANMSLIQVHAAKDVRQNEWMYQLQEGEKEDPFAAINLVFECILDERMEDAHEALKICEAQPNNNAAVSNSIHIARQLVSGAVPQAVAFS